MGAYLKQALASFVRLGSLWMEETKTLTYYDKVLITAVKMFIVWNSGS
jgi:hypothetical protein